MALTRTVSATGFPWVCRNLTNVLYCLFLLNCDDSAGAHFTTIKKFFYGPTKIFNNFMKCPLHMDGNQPYHYQYYLAAFVTMCYVSQQSLTSHSTHNRNRHYIIKTWFMNQQVYYVLTSNKSYYEKMIIFETNENNALIMNVQWHN